MTPTRIRMLLAVAVVMAGGAWGVSVAIDAIAARMVAVPVVAPIGIWLLAIAVLFWALFVRPRLRKVRGARPMPPILAARTAALAMAASRTGAILAGAYAGVALGLIPWLRTPAGVQAIWASGICVAGSVVLVAAALWLERLCRIREDSATT